MREKREKERERERERERSRQREKGERNRKKEVDGRKAEKLTYERVLRNFDSISLERHQHCRTDNTALAPWHHRR